MSLGSRTAAACPAPLRDAIQRADDVGILVVAAAGNNGGVDANGLPTGGSADRWPGNCSPDVLVVGAIDAGNTYAGFSNFGTQVDLSAPGSEIRSTAVVVADPVNLCGVAAGSGQQYRNCNGTSMAAPLVSGVAALMYSYGVGVIDGTQDERVHDWLRSTTSTMNCTRGAGNCGTGRLNALAALQAQELAVHFGPAAGFEPLGGCAQSSPDATDWGAGRLDFFYRCGTQLYHRYYQNGWSPSEENLGGPSGLGVNGIVGDPGAVSDSSNRINVFARGSDNALWMRSWTGGGWTTWASLGKPSALVSLASGPDVASWAPGRFDVFGVGSDGNVWRRAYQGSWSAWENLGKPSGSVSATGSPSAVSWGSGRIDLFIRGSDGKLWHRAYQNGWLGWDNPAGGGQIVGGPDAASWASGRLDVFVRGTDSRLYRVFWNGSTFSRFENHGGILASDPGVVSWGAGRIDIFLLGSGGGIYHRYRA